ncbi:hypothetical protein GCM10022403_093690 [Streptomyces coacervatus]|uniref:Uncharacterized protein n=1 Tax=Streptomyces coacervatus TaxID=647381 RepID=A0ABP7JLC5_9ACTN
MRWSVQVSDIRGAVMRSPRGTTTEFTEPRVSIGIGDTLCQRAERAQQQPQAAHTAQRTVRRDGLGTGMDADDPPFTKRWAPFLREVGAAVQ